MYNYKFYYVLNFKEKSVLFTDDSRAMTFFALLVNQNIPFKVYTLQRRIK